MVVLTNNLDSANLLRLHGRSFNYQGVHVHSEVALGRQDFLDSLLVLERRIGGLEDGNRDRLSFELLMTSVGEAVEIACLDTRIQIHVDFAVLLEFQRPEHDTRS